MKYLIAALACFTFSCKKEKSCEGCVGDAIYKNATIIYSGPVEADGCGWLIKTDDSHNFHPDALSSSFQEDLLPVKITYTLTTDNFICGIAALQIPVIHLTSIQKR